MRLPEAVNLVRCLMGETFRQALASRLSWVMLAMTAAAVLFCAGISIHGGDPGPEDVGPREFIPKNDPQFEPGKVARSGVSPIEGTIALGFGAIKIDLGRDGADAVRNIQVILSSGVAGTLGLLLTLIWTASFLPSFLEPQAAAVLVAKPTPRWLLLLGKFVGVHLVVTIQASLFVGGTWLTLGLATGVWTSAYLLTIPMLLLQFSFFYSVSMFLAVATRSHLACLIGTLVFWLACSAVNVGRVEMLGQSGFIPSAVELGYWILPKPIDASKILNDILDAQRFASQWGALKDYHPGEFSIATSLLFTGLLIAISAFDFNKVEY